MSQIALPLDWPPADEERDFVLGEPNRLAVRQLEHRGLWPVCACLLVGPRKSGRSLLGRLFAARASATLIDDAEGRPEEALFHAWNRAQAQRRPLLLIADAPPPLWPVALPDLRSRLAATPVARIEPPDEPLAAELIERLMARRGLPVPPTVALYLARRIERSYVAIHRAVDALDAAAHRRRRMPTIGTAREALESL
ncbi:DnaA ATPase domain-containing protein [Sphingomonas jatrophae]|uniref:DnaA protein n=1 Tax=Sphingomonas jatrophae TaxID=1166337 RepID=A0A1I6L5L6_9SPHN|nr:DnaA/Hda family protein [Sphingomonas jatrophae]SFR98560.1 dnaA protein [Sphingomonas jatrophae]